MPTGGTHSEGERAYVVCQCPLRLGIFGAGVPTESQKCSNPATQEDLLCDRCREKHKPYFYRGSEESSG
jgi:hypothetical protein